MDIEAGRLGCKQQQQQQQQQHPPRLNRFGCLRRLILLALMFTVSLSMLAAVFTSLLSIPDKEDDMDASSILVLPRNLADLKLLRSSLEAYQQQHKRRVQVSIACLYLFLQAYMLPGSIFLNILAGSFYGFYEALLLVTLLAAVGSSCCYVLSRLLLKDLVEYYFPDQFKAFRKQVYRHQHNLLNYVLFLRITPLLPNWFINVCSPLVSVPFRVFFLGTLIGVIPAGVVAVKAGRILSRLNSLNDLYDLRTMAALFLLAFMAILPALYKKRVLALDHPQQQQQQDEQLQQSQWDDDGDGDSGNKQPRQQQSHLRF